MKPNADHFSSIAADYSRFRPLYPPELFAYLASLTAERHLAWDVGTGNGQSARELAEYFVQVIATDLSEEQLRHAETRPNVQYRSATAEDSGIAAGSVNLTVAAQSLHWFDLPRFYAEVRRVAAPGGVFAAISYGFHHVAPAVDAVLDRLNSEYVGPSWPPERRHVETGYRGLPFPFDEIAPPAFAMNVHWRLDDYLGYLRTWSATDRFERQHGYDPVTRLAADFEAAWGNPAEPRTVTWDLHLRIGRVN